MKRKILWMTPLLGVILVIVLIATGKKKPAASHLSTVKVSRGTVIEKALAIGTIEPVSQISVKSKISGVVKRLFVDEGDYVKKGEPLLEVQPEPTPMELAEAKRQVELARIEMENLRLEWNRQKKLYEEGLVSEKQLEDAERAFRQAQIRYKIASERLALLEKGKVQVENMNIETIVRAPISGYVLERNIEPGDPVVPLTSYQEGTVLMRIADMSQLIFRGTVDEIDVGKLREGMQADIQIGALPNIIIKGEVSKIALKSTKRENATVFPVEIRLQPDSGVTLRAGYSANATIIVEKHENVLTIPERVVIFRDGKTFVRVPGPDGNPVEKEIEIGLSNAITVEVISGLKEGDLVYEKPVRKIE